MWRRTLVKKTETVQYYDYISSDDHSSQKPDQMPVPTTVGIGHLGDSFNKFLREKMPSMQLVGPTILLFALNLLDGLLTIIWVRSGVATEGNQLMARLLDMGNGPFLFVKIGIGLIAAVVLLRWRHRRLARYGVTLALAVYIGLMGVHIFTGLSAFGYVSNATLQHLTDISGQFFAIFV